MSEPFLDSEFQEYTDNRIADLERQLLLAQQLQLVHLDALRRVSAALLPEVKS